MRRVKRPTANHVLLAPLVVALLLNAAQQGVYAQTPKKAMPQSPISMKEEDFKTAKGQIIEHMRDGVIYSVLLERSFYVLLNPDEWTCEGEGEVWAQWIDKFAHLLCANWDKISTVPSQQTVKIRIYPNKKFDLPYVGRVLTGKAKGRPRSERVFGAVTGTELEQHNAEVQSAIKKSLGATEPFPAIGYPLVNLSVYVTLGNDAEMFPRYGAPDFGSVTVLDADGSSISYYSNDLGSADVGGSITVGGIDLQKVYDETRAGRVITDVPRTAKLKDVVLPGR